MHRSGRPAMRQLRKAPSASLHQRRRSTHLSDVQSPQRPHFRAVAAGRPHQSTPETPAAPSAGTATAATPHGMRRARSVGARRVVNRGPDGKPFCEGCYSRPKRKCVRCGDTRPVKANTTSGPVCSSCYVHPQRLCGSCGRIRRIKTRARDGHPDLCGNCDPGPTMTCSSCGRERPCLRVTTDTPVCRSCRDRPQRTCARCARQRPTTAWWPMGPVCDGCYRYICVNPAECVMCGERRPLIGIDEQQRQVCGPCVGVDLTYPCSTCGNAGDIYRNGECARCVLRDQLNEQFGPTEGTPLQPLTSALGAVEKPRPVLLWMPEGE